jgi:hypothetical protein
VHVGREPRALRGGIGASFEDRTQTGQRGCDEDEREDLAELSPTKHHEGDGHDHHHDFDAQRAGRGGLSVLIGEGVITEDDYKAINKEAGAEAEASAAFAIKSPYPDESEIFDDIYWEVDNHTEAGRTGRHFFHG